jgi:DNA-directed RNA polymerase specialized sigma24 family protein
MTRRDIPTGPAVLALADRCRRRAASQWRKRYPSVDRGDFEGILAESCLRALIEFDPGHKKKASIETFAISKVKTALARENGEARYGIALDQLVDDEGQAQDGEMAIFRTRPDLYGHPSEAEHAELDDEQRIRERLAILPPALRDFARVIVDDALSAAQAAAWAGVSDRQARYNIQHAVERLELAGRWGQGDLLDGGAV